MRYNNNNKLKIATVFSGIGAPEFALKRLGIPHEVIFACDNGEVDPIEPEEIILETIKKIPTLEERKQYVKSKINPKKKNYVKTSYLANYQIREELFYDNVRFLEGTEYRNKVDLFIGGSPCQSFTLLGYQKGLEEARGTLFYDWNFIIKIN